MDPLGMDVPANRDWCPFFMGFFKEELRQIYTKELQISRRNQVWIVTDPPFGDLGDRTVLYMIGTPLFLSNRFFCGWNLFLTKTNNENGSEAKQVSGGKVETFCWLFWQGMKAWRKVLLMILIKIRNNVESSWDLCQSWDIIHHQSLRPGKLTWNLKMTQKRNIIFQTSIFGFHVSFQGCKSSISLQSRRIDRSLTGSLVRGYGSSLGWWGGMNHSELKRFPMYHKLGVFQGRNATLSLVKSFFWANCEAKLRMFDERWTCGQSKCVYIIYIYVYSYLYLYVYLYINAYEHIRICY